MLVYSFFLRLNMSNPRDKLPYRETTICFIIYKGKIICKFAGNNSYAKFPGGGVDKGETPKNAVIREIKEEIGVTVKKIT
jgi:8-oxo-dGTP pyrophosphatase MutT (NUDIX family)